MLDEVGFRAADSDPLRQVLSIGFALRLGDAPCFGGVGREVDWSTLIASKKGRPEPGWVAILEDIRSQNRSTLEAVESSRTALTERIDRFEERTESRFTSRRGCDSIHQRGGYGARQEVRGEVRVLG